MHPTDRDGRDHPASATRRVARNTIYLGLADAGGKLLSFLFYLLAARHLGVAGFGVLSFALAFVTMLNVFTDLGLGTIASRDIARDPAAVGRHAGAALCIKLIASVVVMGMIYVLANLIGYPAATIRIVSICSLSVVANTVAAYYCNVYQGLERMELVALTRASQTLLMVTGAAVLAQGAPVVDRYALLYVTAAFLSLFVAVGLGIGRVSFKLEFDTARWAKLLRESVPLGLVVVFTMFYYWSGTTILAKVSGPQAVGNYSAAFRLVTGMTFASFAFSNAVFPLLSRLFVSDSHRSTRAFGIAARYMVMFVIPVGCFAMVFAGPLIRLLYGGGYQGAEGVLRVLVWWGVLASVNSLVSNYLLSVNRTRVVVIQTCLSLGVALLLNIALARALSAMGIAVSIVTAEFAGLVLMLVQRQPVSIRAVAAALAPAVARVLAVTLASVLVAVEVMWTGAVLAALVGFTIYGVLLVLVGGLNEADLRALRPLIQRSDAHPA